MVIDWISSSVSSRLGMSSSTFKKPSYGLEQSIWAVMPVLPPPEDEEEFQGYDDFTNKKSAVVLNFVYTQTKKGGEFSFTLQYSNMVWVILADCEIL